MKPDKPLWPRATLLALSGINLFNYLDRQVLPAVLTPLKADLHLSDSQLGTVNVAFMLGYFLTSPFFGYLGDRLSRRWLIAAGVLVWSAGTMLTGWAETLVVLVAFRALVGLGEASYGTISPGWIADLFPPVRRNFALSVFYVAIPVGSALGYILGSVVEAHFGWRAAFLGAGAPGLLLALGLLTLREPPRGACDSAAETAAAPPAAGGLAVYGQLRHSTAYVLTVLGYVAQTFALGAFAFWGPTFLQRVHGMTLEGAGTFFGGALVVTGLAATLLGGWVATCWQRKHPAGYAWTLALSMAASVPVAVAAFWVQDLTLTKLFLAAAMFLIFLPTGPVNTLILETVPVTMRASAMAASIFSIHLFGDLWSPKIVGIISDRCGSLQTAALWTLPGALVVCTFFWCWLVFHQTKERRRTA